MQLGYTYHMGRGKKHTSVSVSSHPRSLGPLPESIQVQMAQAANNAPSLGSRVELVKMKGPRQGLHLGAHGTVLSYAIDGFVVDFDDDVQLLIRYKSDQWLEVTAREVADRKKIIQEVMRLTTSSRRVSIIPRSHDARAVCRRGWRGEIVEVLDNGNVRIRFDRGGEAVLDPLREDWENITHQEQTTRRKKIATKKDISAGSYIELVAGVPGEPSLVAGLRGVVRTVNSSGTLEMDWDEPGALNLQPDDPIRVLAQLNPEELAEHHRTYSAKLLQAARSRRAKSH